MIKDKVLLDLGKRQIEAPLYRDGILQYGCRGGAPHNSIMYNTSEPIENTELTYTEKAVFPNVKGGFFS